MIPFGEKDVFLYYPYHPFDYVIDLLKTAALDPQVSKIKICLYRVARDSRVIDALVNAVQNGKQVLAVVELAARFDEAANIDWAQRLTENGIQVIIGLPGLKVHSKILLIERREGNASRFYSHVGTGNSAHLHGASLACHRQARLEQALAIGRTTRLIDHGDHALLNQPHPIGLEPHIGKRRHALRWLLAK